MFSFAAFAARFSWGFCGCPALVSVADMPAAFVRMLQDRFQFVSSPTYMRSDSEHRWLDAFECYSGVASIAPATDRVT